MTTEQSLQEEGYCKEYIQAYERWLEALDKRSNSKNRQQFENAQLDIFKYAKIMNTFAIKK